MAKKTTRYAYFFGGGKSEGKAAMRKLLGGKGANLAEMSTLGLPVPAGFTITTEMCAEYCRLGCKSPRELAPQIDANIARLEKVTGKTFGHGSNPLLVSVRSGAAVSMPGMMDTVLNLGLNDATLKSMIERSGNERFVWDSYRRFMQMFGDVVLGIDHNGLEAAMNKVKKTRRAATDTDLDVDGIKAVVAEYQKVYKKACKSFPQDVRKQLQLAVDAVFGSWNNPRAIKYRQLNGIRGLLGTAVNVQEMVFGNMGDDCGTGVAFTRNPATGTNKFYGEFFMNAQGEDVVAGIRTPKPISQLRKYDAECYTQLLGIRGKLEKHYRDVQDVEFTIEKGKLFMLQTRRGERTAAAAIKIAVDMMNEGLITEKEAVCRIDPRSLDQLLHPQFDPKSEKVAKVFATDLPASPGAATGKIVFSTEGAERWNDVGEQVILVRVETSPEDIGGMHAAKGILTARGGMTSHAAVVARGMGKCCITGAEQCAINYGEKTVTVGKTTLRKGDWISLNGSTGTVYVGKIATVFPKLAGSFRQIMKLADKYRTLGVRANADRPADTAVAVKFGAEGIGLTRTEHMFFEGNRIISMRKMILAEDKAGRKASLKTLLPLQRKDFIGIFRALKGRPATIRFLDPPLHEFVPHDRKGQAEMARAMRVSLRTIRKKVDSLHEFNPMLGHRGCRLGIYYPVITAMQARATGTTTASPPAVGVSPEYGEAEANHWVAKNIGFGKFITLEDGSLWEIAPIDTIDTMLWLPADSVMVIASGWPLFPYKLINLSQGDSAEAKCVGTAMGAYVFVMDFFRESWPISFMLTSFYMFCGCVAILFFASIAFPQEHTEESRKLVWDNPLDALKRPGWKGIGNYKFLAALLLAIMAILYLIFDLHLI